MHAEEIKTSAIKNSSARSVWEDGGMPEIRKGTLVQYLTSLRFAPKGETMRITRPATFEGDFLARYDPPLEGTEAWRNDHEWLIHHRQIKDGRYVVVPNV